ncbi:MAG: helix-turn-helix domain-containing protein, partial [Bacteroidota bacterium]
REVSQAINQGLDCSFIDFVNQYRVQAFKERVEKGEASHLSLLGLALESGFNSKSTFNRVFKKLEGISPSEYQKGLKT